VATSKPRGRRPAGSAEALVDDLAQRITARIMGGDIPSGSWLRQETLAAEFGVSRTPIREALRKLQASGTVSLVPHRGAFVRGPTARGIRESYLVRAELEGFAAELAAEWITDPQVARLRDAVERGRDAVAQHRDGAGAHDAAGRVWAEANDAFHETVQEAAANTRLVQSIHDVHRSFPRDLTWTALAEDARLLEANIAQHEAVLDALAARDAVAARRTMTDHVRRSGEILSRRFEQQAELLDPLD
jgi:DNA-binding GntR family transcriptional regulator